MADTLIRRTLTRQQPFAYEEDLPPQVSHPVDQEEFVFAGQRQTIPWTARPFLDEDGGSQLTNFYLDHHEFAALSSQRQAQPWNAVPFLDEDAAANLVNFFLEQEEHWRAQVQALPWMARLFLDEDGGSGLKNFFLEQEEFLLQFQREVVAWTARPFTDEDALSIPVAPFGLDEEGIIISGLPFPDVMRALSWWLRRSPQPNALDGTDEDGGAQLTHMKAPNLPFLARDPESKTTFRTKRNWEILVGVINSLMGSGQLVQISPGIWQIVPGGGSPLTGTFP